jgi:hypothetical protein
MLITHQPTESTFEIEPDNEVFYLKSTIEDSSENAYDDLPMDWDELLLKFGEWVDEVRIETDAPDLWDDILQGNEFFSDAPRREGVNTPFTTAERAQIAAQLNEIRAYVKEACTLSIEQTARMEAAFDEAEKASSRMGRKDWLLLFGGTLLSLVTSAIIPGSVVEQVLLMTAQNIGHMFGFPPYPLMS